jgi:hypothetical protein
VGGRGRGAGGKGRGGRKGREMTQSLYAHMNKRNEKQWGCALEKSMYLLTLTYYIL